MVTLSPANPGPDPITVQYTTADDTAAAGSDYVAASGTLTFATGHASKPVTVSVNGDLAFEADETFTVTLPLRPVVPPL